MYPEKLKIIYMTHFYDIYIITMVWNCIHHIQKLFMYNTIKKEYWILNMHLISKMAYNCISFLICML